MRVINIAYRPSKPMIYIIVGTCGLLYLAATYFQISTGFSKQKPDPLTYLLVIVFGWFFTLGIVNFIRAPRTKFIMNEKHVLYSIPGQKIAGKLPWNKIVAAKVGFSHLLLQTTKQEIDIDLTQIEGVNLGHLKLKIIDILEELKIPYEEENQLIS
ncbi:MAG: hypothetical protein LBD45_09825 [Bacteroidales bacterium]|jgi:predicted membrane channel-forming protein YqfA (hemolysin III family)|nr:hypothetical protein [Bacteroidales bacterium]